MDIVLQALLSDARGRQNEADGRPTSPWLQHLQHTVLRPSSPLPSRRRCITRKSPVVVPPTNQRVEPSAPSAEELEQGQPRVPSAPAAHFLDDVV